MEIRRFLGDGDLPFMEFVNDFASAKVCLQGAHLVEYKSKIGEDFIWTGKNCIFQKGIAIRGGVPICLPWFGTNKDNSDFPVHGFARISLWNFVGSESLLNGEHKLFFELMPNELTKKYFVGNFIFRLEILLGKKLEMQLFVKNVGEIAFEIGGAFHTYLPTDDIEQTKIAGLDDHFYIDATDNFQQKKHRGLVDFSTEVDKIFLNVKNKLILHTPKTRFKLEISGASSVVVWNPHIEKSKKLSGFGYDDYKKMFCVEVANCFDDVRIIEPKSEHCLTYKLEII